MAVLVQKRDSSTTFNAQEDSALMPLRVVATAVDRATLSAIVRDKPRQAAAVASDYIAKHPAAAPQIFSILFGRGDIETAEAVLRKAGLEITMKMRGAIVDALEASINAWYEVRSQSYSEVEKYWAPRRVAYELFDRFMAHGKQGDRPKEVDLPQFGQGKFLLMESDGGFLVRMGGPDYKTIVTATQRELVNLGCPKTARSIKPIGGGYVQCVDNVIVFYPNRTKYGPPDYNVLRRFIASARPNADISIAARPGCAL